MRTLKSDLAQASRNRPKEHTSVNIDDWWYYEDDDKAKEAWS